MLLAKQKFVLNIKILGTAVAAISFLIICIHFTLSQNWLGLSLQSNTDGYGIKVETVYNKELKAQLTSGDVIIAVQNVDFGTAAVNSETVHPHPSLYTRDSVEHYLAFLNNENRLFNILKQKVVQLVLINGSIVSVKVLTRNLNDIPFNFWIQITFSILAVFIGYFVYFKQQKEAAIRHFLVSVSGFFIMGSSWAVLINRSVALSGDVYRTFDVLSHLGITLIVSGLLSMVWCYPRRLEPRKMPGLIYSILIFFWIVDSLHLIDSLTFAFYSPMFFSFAFITVFAVMQWQVTSKLPADRTILKWMFFFILSATGFLLLLVFIPRSLTTYSLVTPNVQYALLLFFYFGIALVLTRYRMINLEFWWSFMWGSYFALSISALIYFILITAFKVNSILVLSISIFLGAISFYPFRQWIKSQFKTAPQHELEHYLPTLVELLFTARSNHSLSMQWESILTRIFNPITLTSRKNPVDKVEITADGTIMRVPDFQPEYALELAYSNQGKRLFVNADVQLAQTMYQLTRKAIDLNLARNKGAEEERTRIVRDLHDDVGAKLITIIHRAGSSQVADLCRSALQDIRDIMSYLGGGLYALPAMIADWRSEADSRCEAANIQLKWNQSDIITNLDLDSRTRMNLTRVFRETITNSIKHGQPNLISADIIFKDSTLSFYIKDNGNAQDVDKFIKGRGLHNMKERMDEIGGTIQWSINEPHGVIVQVTIKVKKGASE